VLVDALLDDGEDELAWQAASAPAGVEPGERAWLRLAESSAEDPSGADVLA